MSSHIEDEHLIAYFDWVRINENFDDRFKAIFHIANERKTSPQAGKRLKRKGVKAGVADVCIPIPRGNYVGCWIELKIKPNKITDSQHDFLTMMGRLGHCVRIAWSTDELIQYTREYFNEPDTLVN